MHAPKDPFFKVDYFFGCTIWYAEISLPGIEPKPLKWKCGVLTTGPPGKPPTHLIALVYCSLNTANFHLFT